MIHPAPDASTAPPAEPDTLEQPASMVAGEFELFVPGIPVVDIAGPRKPTRFFGWPLRCPGRMLDRDLPDLEPVGIGAEPDRFRCSVSTRSLGQ